ncbi:hypothetical protein KUL156_18550 [Alteromonas sp. KUL156]|nr:hypothetical protein KUL154_45010 [Alteromonas sp. KUL154]GFD99262.1 hypothetical protein KUL156_18550 [Alteromonas sp. KUL156]
MNDTKIDCEKLRLFFKLLYLDYESRNESFLAFMEKLDGYNTDELKPYFVPRKTLSDFLAISGKGGTNPRQTTIKALIDAYVAHLFYKVKGIEGSSWKDKRDLFKDENGVERSIFKQWKGAFSEVLSKFPYHYIKSSIKKNFTKEELEETVEKLVGQNPETVPFIKDQLEKIESLLAAFHAEYHELINSPSVTSQKIAFQPSLTLNQEAASPAFPISGELTFVGRKNELEYLWGFLESDERLSWWQIAGINGSGKTRLALAICKGAREKEWEAGFLEEQNLQELIKNIDEWTPQKSTLLVLDGILLRKQRVYTLMKELKEKFEKELNLFSLRIVIIENERLFKTEDHEDELDTYFLQERLNTEFADFNSFCYNAGEPLELGEMGTDELLEIVNGVLVKKSQNKVSEDEIGVLLDKLALSKTPSVAQYLGYWLSIGGKEDTSVDRILDHILEQEERSRLDKNPSYKEYTHAERDTALMLVAQAIVTNGLDMETLLQHEKSTIPSKRVRDIAALYTLSDDRNIIPPAHRGLMGVWFVARVIDRIGSESARDFFDLCWRVNEEAVFLFLAALTNGNSYTWQIDYVLSLSHPQDDLFDSVGVRWVKTLTSAVRLLGYPKGGRLFACKRFLKRLMILVPLWDALVDKSIQKIGQNKNKRIVLERRIDELCIPEEPSVLFEIGQQSNLPISSILHQKAFSLFYENGLSKGKLRSMRSGNEEQIFIASEAFRLINQFEETNEAFAYLGIISYFSDNYVESYEAFRNAFYGGRKWRFKHGPYHNITCRKRAFSPMGWLWVDVNIRLKKYEVNDSFLYTLFPRQVFNDGYIHYINCCISQLRVEAHLRLKYQQLSIRHISRHKALIIDEIKYLYDNRSIFYDDIKHVFDEQLVESVKKADFKLAELIFTINLHFYFYPRYINSMIIKERGPLSSWDLIIGQSSELNHKCGLSLEECLMRTKVDDIEAMISFYEDLTNKSRDEVVEFLKNILKIECKVFNLPPDKSYLAELDELIEDDDFNNTQTM